MLLKADRVQITFHGMLAHFMWETKSNLYGNLFSINLKNFTERSLLEFNYFSNLVKIISTKKS